jgi:hypothetical protein
MNANAKQTRRGPGRRAFAALGVFAGLAALASPWFGFAAELPTIRQQQGPLELTVTAQGRDGRVEMSLSDSLQVTITVTGPADVEIKPPAALTTSQAWKVPSRPVEPGFQAPGWRQTFVVYPQAPGQQVLQIEPFQYRDKGGAWSTVTWKPIPAKVSTQITEADVKDLRDITDIEKLPPAPSLWDWAPWVLGVPALTALFVIGIRRFRQRHRSVSALSPAQWARRELDRIQALDLPAAGEFERFHTLLSNVIRRYLENRFELPARRQTTPEFLQAMEKSSLLPPEQQCVLRGFLERCDLAKFARARPAADECLATLEMARQFVEQTSTSQIMEKSRPERATDPPG